MNKPFAKTSDQINMKCDWFMVGLAIIFLLTIFNGYFNSLNVEYGADQFWQCTYLGDPRDLHADLIKCALSLSPDRPLFLDEWSSHYQEFYLHNPYGGMGDISSGRVTTFGVTPLTLLTLVATLHALWSTGPDFVMTVYYALCLLGLGFLCRYFIAKWRDRITAFIVLAFGYPFMIMLTRGNIGAVITGFALIPYIYFSCNRRHLVVAAICLAIACNVRPNAILLAPLFLCFGFRKSVIATVLFLGIAGTVTAVSYALACYLLPGYSYHVFWGALQIYEHLFVIGNGALGYNNTIYGALKVLCILCNVEFTEGQLRLENSLILLVCVATIAWASYKNWQGRLPAYYFAFVLTCLYILASTVFSTYHLLVLYAFIILAGSKPVEAGPFPTLLFLMTALILIPKNYYYPLPYVSFEVILNPMILLGCIVWILFMNFPLGSEDLTPHVNAPSKTNRKRKH